MLRLLRTLYCYFAWQALMRWTTLAGLILFALGLWLVPSRLTPSWVTMSCFVLGTSFAVGVPAFVAPFCYRTLVSNRRLLIVPNLRRFAAAALLLLAIIVAAASAIVAHRLALDGAAQWRVTLFAFAAVSTYFLLSQWLVTRTWGVFAFVLGFLLFPRTVAVINHNGVASLAPILVYVGATVLGWIWLLLTSISRGAPKPFATFARISMADLNESGARYMWLPQFGTGRSAAGTLMRGMRDGWGNRIVLAVIMLLALPVSMFVLLFLVDAPLRNPNAAGSPALLFLYISIYGLMVQSIMMFSEWPARLRPLWLRNSGNREALWRLLETTLFEDALLIAALSGVVAFAFLAVTTVSVQALVFYVSGCTLVTLLSAYCGFWIRAIGWNRFAQVLFVVGLTIVGSATLIFYLRDEIEAEVVARLSFALAILTIGFRWLAQRCVVRIDWCDVRPLRAIRRLM